VSSPDRAQVRELPPFAACPLERWREGRVAVAVSPVDVDDGRDLTAGSLG
jgi:hypothetical protein